MESTKETKELAEAVVELICFGIKRSKDGISADDALALVMAYVADEKFRTIMNNGVLGANKILAEGKDLSADEISDLLKELLLNYVPRIMAAIKG